jgi:hypothetical protein
MGLNLVREKHLECLAEAGMQHVEDLIGIVEGAFRQLGQRRQLLLRRRIAVEHSDPRGGALVGHR